jgi:integrase
MGVIIHRGQIAASKCWPDRTKTIRVCKNRTQANDLQKLMDAAVVNGTWREYKEQLKLRNRNRITLSDFAGTYIKDYAKPRNKPKTVKRKETSLLVLKDFMGSKELESITASLVHKYVQKRKEAGKSNATVNRDVTTLKHLLTYAQDCGLIKKNLIEDFKLLKEDLNERPRFSNDQVDAVISELRADVKPLFIFIRETGCRREEALSLRHSQVQAESRMVVFNHDTKSRKYRYVPLTDAALEAVETLPKLDECPYVFYNLKTKERWFDGRKLWEQAREAAGVPELTIKDLRRLYAIKLAEAEAGMHDIQQVLGHASVSTTEKHYAQFSPSYSAARILRVLKGGKTNTDTKRIHANFEGDPSQDSEAVNA